MKALSGKPTNQAERLRRGIAIVLDEAFIADRKTPEMHKLNTFFAADFDVLVDKLAKAAEHSLLKLEVVNIRPTRTGERFNPTDLWFAWFDGDAAGAMAQTQTDAFFKVIQANPRRAVSRINRIP